MTETPGECPKCKSKNRSLQTTPNQGLLWFECFDCKFESREATKMQYATKNWNAGIKSDF